MRENQRPTILVVDDYADGILVLSRVLSDEFTLVTATNGLEALDILATRTVDLIISDHVMPVMTGIELFQKVSVQYPLIGRILLTGAPDLKEVMAAAINRGAVDKFLAKPVNPKDLKENISEVLRARAIINAAMRLELESQLIHCDKMASLGGLLAGIAHEINNPLSFVSSNLTNLTKFTTKVFDLLECYEQLDLPAEMRKVVEEKNEAANINYLKTRIPEMIEKSQQGAERMRKIIQELKIFSRADDNVMEKADIHAALDSVLDILHNEYKNRIIIKKEYGNLPQVTCSISKLAQVFMNILVNACHAMPEKGEIRITTTAQGDLVSVTIQDSGSGIPEEVQRHIFEPFFTTKAVGKGTGLGLSISHAIIQQHRGKIAVASKMGEGSTFTITLPIETSMTK